MQKPGTESSSQPTVLNRVLSALRRVSSRRRAVPIRDAGELQTFLQSRASFVAQSTLYGYLRTRAGVRFPELFDDDPFVASINIAKWHVWLACLSDLAVYSGGMLRHACPARGADVGALICRLVEEILQETGMPPDAGPMFIDHGLRVRARLALCDWAQVQDDETSFTQSPAALVEWAPVIDDLKRLDAEIVRNSVRFRWQEVRRDVRNLLDPEAIMASVA